MLFLLFLLCLLASTCSRSLSCRLFSKHYGAFLYHLVIRKPLHGGFNYSFCSTHSDGKLRCAGVASSSPYGWQIMPLLFYNNHVGTWISITVTPHQIIHLHSLDQNHMPIDETRRDCPNVLGRISRSASSVCSPIPLSPSPPPHHPLLLTSPLLPSPWSAVITDHSNGFKQIQSPKSAQPQ